MISLIRRGIYRIFGLMAGWPTRALGGLQKILNRVGSMDFLDNRRKHPRYSINLPVFIFHSKKRALGHTLDVGLGGMRIHTDQVFLSRRGLLFQLMLKRNSIWVKGRLVFTQTQPDLLNFSCVQFEETSKENLSLLQEYLARLENFSGKERPELESRIREGESALAKANELLQVEKERRKRVEQVLEELEERLRSLSSELADFQEKKIKLTVQELHDTIEAMISGMTDGLKNILIRIKEGNISDPLPFEQIIFNIQKNHKEMRRILENLPSISDELGILSNIGWHCRKSQKIYHGTQDEQERDIPGKARPAEVPRLQDSPDKVTPINTDVTPSCRTV